ncbi:MAG: hypothetical protein WBA22_10530 [Candidatus Methanofastidiosia archaeon]
MKAFVIMPFEDKIADDIYRHSTKPICEGFGLEIQRADEIFTANPILDDILTAIEEAAVIIADVSGKNPNVFYELGLAHMLKRKQTVMITHDEYEALPFDVSHFRIMKYENTIRGKVTYEVQLKKTLQNILRDYKLIYKEEFELMINILMSAEKTGDLYALISLSKAPGPLDKHEPLHVEGHNSELGTSSSKLSISVEDGVSAFIRLGYAEVLGDLVILADKGKAFVELLEKKGFICDFVNGNILSEGYIPFDERTKL